VQIRRLLEGNEEAARRVVEELKFTMDAIAGVSVDPACMRAFLADDRHYLIAAYADETPVAFLLAYQLARVDGPASMMFLYEIGVQEQHRRMGTGRALVEELKRLARENGCIKMFVGTNTSNEPAMALYRCAGGARAASDEAEFEWKW